MEILFLDDSPRRRLEFAKRMVNDKRNDGGHLLLVETYDQAVAALRDQPVRFDQVWLDRDLNDYESISVAYGLLGSAPIELTGEDVAEYITTMPENRRPLEVFVHSWNPDAGRRMVKVCAAAGIRSTYLPFGNPQCGTCNEPIQTHTGDGRRDGTGYICPPKGVEIHDECGKMHSKGYCACTMVSCFRCGKQHPAHKPCQPGAKT